VAGRTYLRCAISILTGLWVTIGAAVPIGYAVLTLLRSANGGQLGPELLERSGVVLSLLAGYAVAAAIGGWAAGWVTIEKSRRLIALLSASHVGTWLFVLATGASPFEPRIVLGLAPAAVVGTIAGVSVRARQVGRRSRPAVAE
jgi:xanthine/uracil permease